jgi:O-methyltransferase
MRRPISEIVQGAFSLIGFDLQRNSALWDSDGDFAGLLNEIRGKTLVSADRCFMLHQLVRHAGALDGDMAEVGVYRGGTARLLARSCPHKTMHLFDTFSGLPKPDQQWDRLPESDFKDTSLAEVKHFLADCVNVRFYPGLFPDTAQDLRGLRFCFAYADADLYESTRSCLTFFYPRLVPGGVLVIDDYNWQECPGVKQAVGEFLQDKPERPIVARRYQCVIIKLPNHT